MLPYCNLTDDHTIRLWDRDSLMAHLGLSNGDEPNAAGLKKMERLTAESGYFPTLLTLDELRDEHGQALWPNLRDHDVQAIQSRRGKWLALQYWQSADHPAMIIANDGRGSRFWRFINDDQPLGEHLQDFINGLSAHSPQPTLIFLHGKLAAYRHDALPPASIRVAQTSYHEQYNIHIPSDLSAIPPMTPPSHLDRLEAESLHIMREVAAETTNPVMLYSIGKDSAVMLHLARKAFWPGVPPFPLLHVDTGWKFRAMYEFRDQVAAASGMELLIHKNPEGVRQGINPIDHGSALHTDIMKTQGLKQALDAHGFDAAFGGARRDEEKSRAKERIFSFRSRSHQWDPKNQRPELWSLYNTRVHAGESMRVFPLSNWTELDIWSYIYREQIPIVPLYFAKERPVVERDGTLLMVDDDRLPLTKADKVTMRMVRFRTLGCYPLTGAIESQANTLEAIMLELLTARQSERQGRTIDKDAHASMEQKKMEGYF